MDFVVRFHMYDQYHQKIQQADADHALFAVDTARILDQHQWTREDPLDISEIKPVLR